MRLSVESVAPPVLDTRAANAALLAGFVVAALAVHVGLVAAYANPIPFSDEWIALIDNVQRPWAAGTFSFWDLFRPHNEHTMVPTRLTVLLLLWLNHGQYDNIPAALLNAVIYTATFAMAVLLFARHATRGTRAFAIVLGLAALVPLEGNDLIYGFQDQYYFMIAGTLLTLWLAAGAKAASRRALALFAVLAFLTSVSMGSGFFAAALAIGVVALRGWHDPAQRKALRRYVFVAAPIALFGLALLLHSFAVMKQAGILGAKQIDLDGLRRLFSCLAWPYALSAWAGILVSLPFAVFAARLLWRREPAAALDYFALAVGLWVGASICALAFDRNSEAGTLSSRYLPVVLFWPLMNCYALLRLVEDLAPRAGQVGALLRVALPALAGAAVVANVAKMAPDRLAETAMYSRDHVVQAEHLARYVRLGDREALYGAGHMQLPYGNPQKLQEMLDDPAVRAGLPANIRAGLPLSTHEATAFVPFGAYETVPRRDDLPGFGSYAADGDRSVGTFRSDPLTSHFPFVRIDLAGYLPDAGLSLRLECAEAAACTPTEVRPASQAHESWQGVYVKLPPSPFRVHAEDASTARWYAFAAPLEVGRLSVYSDVAMNLLRSEPYRAIAATCGVLVLLLLLGLTRGSSLPVAGEV